MLHLAILLFAQTAEARTAENPGNLNRDLFFASPIASGVKLCDRKRAARYNRMFNDRYGARIRALVRYHESRSGKDPEFIFTTDCIMLGGSNRHQDHVHARALALFEDALEALERRYGPQQGDANPR